MKWVNCTVLPAFNFYCALSIANISIVTDLISISLAVFSFVYVIVGIGICASATSHEILQEVTRCHNDDIYFFSAFRYLGTFFSIPALALILIPFGYIGFVKDQLFHINIKKEEENWKKLFESQKTYDKLLLEDFEKRLGTF